MTAAALSSGYFQPSLAGYLSNGTHEANIGNGATIAINSNITDDLLAIGSISKTGNGNLVLGGQSTFTGGVSVTSGTLRLASDTNYDGQIYSSPVGLGTLALKSGSTLSMVDEYNYRFYNSISLDNLGGTVTVDIPTYGTLTLNSTISGNAALSKSGAGVLTLNSAASNFTGGVDVHGGTVLLASSSVLRPLDTTPTTYQLASGPIGTGYLRLYDGTTLGVPTTTAVTLDNPIALDGLSTATVKVQTQTSQSLTLTGNITGAAELVKMGAGILTLSGANSFTGDLYVNGGTLNLGSNTAAGLGALELGQSQGTVNFTTSAPVIHGLAADNAADSVYMANGSTLTINQYADSIFAGHLDGHGGASVVKNGTGTLTFSQSNDYDGTTTIAGGTLVYGANGAFGSSIVTINGGALKIINGTTFTNPLTLSSGTLAGNYTFSTPQTFGTGVTLSPGNSPGTMTFAMGYAPTSGVSTSFEFNAWSDLPGVNSDLIAVTGGTFDLSGLSAGGYTLHLISLSLLGGNSSGPIDGTAVGASWTIFTSLSALSPADLSKFTLDTTGFVNPGNFSLSLAGGNQNILLNFTPVPEPSTYALMALGLAGSGLAAWRRRRV